MSKPTILIVGTLDTKGSEVLFLRSQILSHGSCQTKVLDVSRSAKDISISSDVFSGEIMSPLLELETSDSLPRGEYIDKATTKCIPVVRDLVSQGQIHGIISAAGSSGTSLATALMRKACPIGFPKLMVSTMASGDIKPYIEETDITMMYSVVDIAGINSILQKILLNAAGAITGMAVTYARNETIAKNISGKRIAVTMFGVTTPCVKHIRRILTSTPHDVSAYEIYVFHATGAGGRAMERLIEEGQIDAVIDLTTTEIPDELFGGVLTAGPNRLEAAAKKGIPMVVSVGACDMINFGPKDTVPENHKGRTLYCHTPSVTLMRTTKAENTKIGEFIVTKLKQNAMVPENIKVVIPKGGVSMIDLENQPFYDTEADGELFETIEVGLKSTKIKVLQCPEHINDEAFAAQICEHLLEVMGVDPRKYRLANARRRKWSFDHGKKIALARRASQVEIPEVS